MHNKRVVALIIISVIFLFVLIPLCLDWLIIGNDFPSNVGNADWIGFFGGYFGALIGAFASLGGVLLTIRFTQKQSANDASLHVRPYCSYQYINHSGAKADDKLIGHLAYGCEPKENDNSHYSGVLYVANVGLGPALDFHYTCSEFNDNRKHYGVILRSSPEIKIRKVAHLSPDEKGAFTFDILFNFDPITEDDCLKIEREDGTVTLVHDPNLFKKYPSYDFTIRCMYGDMFNNVYYNDLLFRCQTCISSNHFDVDIFLKEVSAQQKR